MMIYSSSLVGCLPASRRVESRTTDRARLARAHTNLASCLIISEKFQYGILPVRYEVEYSYRYRRAGQGGGYQSHDDDHVGGVITRKSAIKSRKSWEQV